MYTILRIAFYEDSRPKYIHRYRIETDRPCTTKTIYETKYNKDTCIDI
jgi:hypothetical protein